MLLRICRKSDADDIVSFIDLFPVDFYKDSFTYKDRKILVDSNLTRMISISSPDEFSNLLTDIKEKEKPYLDPNGVPCISNFFLLCIPKLLVSTCFLHAG